jgi:hypothetical protein
MLRAQFLNFPAIRTVYFADVQSHTLYTVIWGGSPHLQQIFIAQSIVSEPWHQVKHTGGPLKPLIHVKKQCLRNLKYQLYSLYMHTSILESVKFV